MSAHNGVINRTALRAHILRLCRQHRPGWRCRLVSEQALNHYEDEFKRKVLLDVQSHPTLGKTFKP